MLQPPIPEVSATGAIEEPVEGDDDRAMDVLQYGTAFFAIIVVVLLAAFH